jgi:cob(I)alamin adenosyltransferase
MIDALMANLDDWIAAVEEIEQHALPTTGNKARALHLMRTLEQAKLTLQHLIDDAHHD